MRPAILAALVVAMSTPAAQAEKIDLSTMTCAKFQASSKDEIGIILTWLDAYYREENDPPVLDTDRFVENAKKLGQFCAENPTLGLITATDKLFSK